MTALGGKVAIVTGGGNGIGRAISTCFAAAGAAVVVLDIDDDAASATVPVDRGLRRAGSFGQGRPAEARRHRFGLRPGLRKSSDASTSSSTTPAVMDALRPPLKVTLEQWETAMAVNATAPFLFCQAVLPSMIAQSAGSIVNIASVAGLTGGRAGTAYTASKHALVGLTRSIAFTHIEDGVRCNAICPGGITTEIATRDDPKDEFGLERYRLAHATKPPSRRSRRDSQGGCLPGFRRRQLCERRRRSGGRRLDGGMSGHPTAPPFSLLRDSKLDPPSQFGEWRSEHPLRRVALWDGREAWAVVGYDAARTVLRDHEHFSSDPTTPGYPTHSEADLATKQSGLLTMVDPPTHTVHRRTVLREFIVKAIDALRPDTERLVADLLDEMDALGPPVDLVECLSAEVPAHFTCRLLGAPWEDAELFRRCLGTRLESQSGSDGIREAETELWEYFVDLVADRGTAPRDDLTSRLVVDHVRSGELAADEAARLLHILLVGGFDTTKTMISVGTLMLIRDPDLRATLRAEPSRWRGTIEELLRHITVIQVLRRACTEDCDIAGRRVRAGEGVLVVLSAANRDPAVFDRPDDLDLENKAVRHIAFGTGIHQCIGQPVARMILQVVYPRLFERFPGLYLDEPTESIRLRDDRGLLGVDALSVAW